MPLRDWFSATEIKSTGLATGLFPGYQHMSVDAGKYYLHLFVGGTVGTLKCKATGRRRILATAKLGTNVTFQSNFLTC